MEVALTVLVRWRSWTRARATEGSVMALSGAITDCADEKARRGVAVSAVLRGVRYFLKGRVCVCVSWLRACGSVSLCAQPLISLS